MSRAAFANRPLHGIRCRSALLAISVGYRKPASPQTPAGRQTPSRFPPDDRLGLEDMPALPAPAANQLSGDGLIAGCLPKGPAASE
jgi:hypothetical protein